MGDRCRRRPFSCRRASRRLDFPHFAMHDAVCWTRAQSGGRKENVPLLAAVPPQSPRTVNGFREGWIGMRSLIRILTFAALAFLAACYPPTTEHPVGTSAGQKQDPQLVGLWHANGKNGDRGA